MNKLKQKIKDKLGEKKTAKLKKALHVARIVKNVVCWTMIAILTLAIIVFMITKIKGDMPTVFGYTLNRIVSGSMEPELQIDDVIISKVVSDPSEIAVGDIITFQGDARFDDQKVTHRVLVAPYSNGRGDYVLVTKGDANETDDGEIYFSAVNSKYLSKSSFFRAIYNFFFSQWGLIIFIAVLLLIFFDEILNVIKIISASREEEEPESIYEVIKRIQREQREEEEQERLIADEAEQKKQAKKAGKTKKAEKSRTKAKEPKQEQEEDESEEEIKLPEPYSEEEEIELPEPFSEEEEIKLPEPYSEEEDYSQRSQEQEKPRKDPSAQRKKDSDKPKQGKKNSGKNDSNQKKKNSGGNKQNQKKNSNNNKPKQNSNNSNHPKKKKSKKKKR